MVCLKAMFHKIYLVHSWLLCPKWVNEVNQQYTSLNYTDMNQQIIKRLFFMKDFFYVFVFCFYFWIDCFPLEPPDYGVSYIEIL